MAELTAASGAQAPLSVEKPTTFQQNGLTSSLDETLKKYQAERLKRLREDGNAQYISPASLEKVSKFQRDVWSTDSTPNPGLDKTKNGDRFKVLIIGAGFGGILFAARLLQAGIKDFVLVDIAGGFGGTWYWNRYPGLMCDVESYIYMPLIEETGYTPRRKYSSGAELRDYAELLADKFELRDKALLRCTIDNMHWDEANSDWVVNLKRLDGKNGGDLNIRSQVVITSTGLINTPKLPNLPGMGDYAGHSFHTSRWDYNFTGGNAYDPEMINLKDKRVGIIGTGATAVQAVPALAKWAKQLYVFQRTPASVDIRNNKDTDQAWFDREVRGSGAGWQRRRSENFNAHVSNTPDAGKNLVDDEWTRMRTFSYVVGTPKRPSDLKEYISNAQELDLPRQEKIRRRIDEIVKDKDTAEKLKPWYSGWCKRPCFHDEYLPAFNQSNVKLVDTDGRGIDRLSKAGPIVNGTEYPVDLLVFGTGYHVPAGDSPSARSGFKAYGKGGRSLDDKWAEGITTLHGVITDEFPNFLFPGPNQSGASANLVYVLDQLSEHIVYMIAEASKKANNGNFVIEPDKPTMEKWVTEIISRAAAFAPFGGCTPSYLNGEGAMDKEKTQEEMLKAARAALWGDGIADYVDYLEKWRAEGSLAGLHITSSS